MPPKKCILGICAMDRKSRSRHMTKLLDALRQRAAKSTDLDLEIVVFGDACILQQDVETWPKCDVLIAFYSHGFPLDKARRYVERNRPYCLNSVELQGELLDRRRMYARLEKFGVPTPPHVVVEWSAGA